MIQQWTVTSVKNSGCPLCCLRSIRIRKDTGMADIIKKTKKKNRKLLVQISLIAFVLFLVSITVISISSALRSFNMYYDSKVATLKQSGKTLLSITEDTNSSVWLLDYIKKNKVNYYWILSADEKTREEGAEAIVKLYALDGSKGTDDVYAFIESLTDEEQKKLAVFMIYEFLRTTWVQIDNKDYNDVLISDISKDNYGYIYYSSFINSADVSELITDNNIIQGIINSKGQETIGETVFDLDYDGGLYLMSYTPVYSDGNAKAVIMFRHDCDDFVSLLWDNLKVMLLTGIIALLIADTLIVLFIYRKAIRPLAAVKNAMLVYKTDKDSKKAAQKMRKIKVRNEVGVLADSFSEMTVELDSYMTENLRLTSERERVAAELEMAAEIQLDMLPKEFPSSTAFELYASMTPAKEVGGDFYDFFMIDEDHLGLVIADVSGKGMPAALFMMKSKIIIKENALSGGTPAQILEKANNAICENNDAMMFVTVWLGILELSTGKLTAANAGHEYPIIRQPDGSFELFKDKHGISLGMRKNRPFKEYELTLPKGSTLFVYTDGAPEATNAEGTLYGTDRLLEALDREPDPAPQKLIEDTHRSIDEFVGDAPQFDDLTMLCVKLK